MHTDTPDTAPHKEILFVDDHELVRLGFRTLMQSRAAGLPGLAVHEARTLAEALAFHRAHQGDIGMVVLDLNLPDTEGASGLLAFRQQYPDVPVVAISGTDNMTLVQNALALGAIAFFPKSGELGEMVDFVHDCLRHGPAVATQQLRQSASGLFVSASKVSDGFQLPLPAGEALSPRQLQILQWVIDGKSNREIGQLAFLTEGSVKNHVSTLLLSFGVRSRAQLICKLRP